MTHSPNKLYCGPPSPRIYNVLGKPCSNDVTTWFEDKRVYYVHKARTAIRFACELIKIGQGDEVLAPAYNCGTEIDALLNSGVSVVLYPTDRTGKVDWNDLYRRITKRTKLIYVTHYFGFPQRLEEVKEICREKEIFLIEDCALSLFSCDCMTKLGSTGDVSVFNFPKTLPVPDGGALVINNPDLAVDNWIMRTPPISGVLRKMLPMMKRYILRISSDSSALYPLLWYILKKTRPVNIHDENYNTMFPDMPPSYYYDEKLSNRKISKITGRMLRTFDISEIISKRRANFCKYLELLSGVKGIEPLYEELPDGICPLYFPIFADKRKQLCQKLNALSIDAIAWWSGYHSSLPWTEYPNARFLKDNLLVLPVHHQLRQSHIEFIARKLLDII